MPQSQHICDFVVDNTQKKILRLSQWQATVIGTGYVQDAQLVQILKKCSTYMYALTA